MFNINKSLFLLLPVEGCLSMNTIILNRIMLNDMILIKADLFISNNSFIKEKQ